jgi:hypothetical protein
MEHLNFFVVRWGEKTFAENNGKVVNGFTMKVKESTVLIVSLCLCFHS